MTILLAFLAGAVLSSSASDFFPLKPGNKWTYADATSRAGLLLVDEVLSPVEIDGQQSFPVRMTSQGQVVQTRYYRSEGDTLYIVAYEAKTPLKLPHPVFKVGERKTSWDFEGETPFHRDLVPLKFSGVSEPKGHRKVFGEEREVLEVRLNAVVEGGPTMRIETAQTALYAKGVGLLELSERRTIAKKTVETKIRLVRFDPAP